MMIRLHAHLRGTHIDWVKLCALTEGGVKNSFGTVVIHPTAYDGCVEQAALQEGFSVVGTSVVDTHYKAARENLKNHLLQAT